MAKYYCPGFPVCRWTGSECVPYDPNALAEQAQHIESCPHAGRSD